MITPSRAALIVMLASFIGFVAGSACGVFFGFPSPDECPEGSARLQFHANVSGSIMLLEFLAFAASIIYLLQQWLQLRKRSRT